MSQWLGIAFHPVEVGLVPISDTAGVSHGIQQRLHIRTMLIPLHTLTSEPLSTTVCKPQTQFFLSSLSRVWRLLVDGLGLGNCGLVLVLVL